MTPRIPWLAGPHGDVLTALRSAVFGGAGTLVLTGEGGTGKSIVARTLAELMRAQGMAIAYLDRPSQTPDDFLQAVGEAYGWQGMAAGTLRATAERHFADLHARGTRALLIVDDAHRLGRDVPAQIALLVKLARQQGADQRPLVTVILVGHERFLETLESPENALLESLIDGRYRLQRLTEDEVQRYIERLVVAAAAPRVLTKAEMSKIAEISRGIPRDIDALCQAAFDGPRRRPPVAAPPPKPAAVNVETPPPAPQPVKSVVRPKKRPPVARVRKPISKTVLVGAGVLTLVALPVAYIVRQVVTPQTATARMRSTVAPPSPPVHVAVPPEPPRVEEPSPAAAPVLESAPLVPEPLPVSQETVVTPPEPAPAPPAVTPPPRPAVPVAPPSVAPPPLRERPVRRAEPPTPAVVSRPTVTPPERPLATPRPAQARPAPQRAEPDPSAVVDWLFRDAPRASD